MMGIALLTFGKEMEYNFMHMVSTKGGIVSLFWSLCLDGILFLFSMKNNFELINGL